KFGQYLSLDYAKALLRDRDTSVLDTALETGLSGTGRLHDLFVGIEAMTPGEYKNGGAGLILDYSFADSPFGEMLVASTAKGICHMAFIESRETGLAEMTGRFPAATWRAQTTELHHAVQNIFAQGAADMSAIKLHLRGTDFQLKVWEALLRIPAGRLSTYGALAKEIGKPAAARAVGSAIGANPVAYLIPCHRVIQGSGHTGGYMWGADRKAAIIGWEAAQAAGGDDEFI
ncbi:MAG TPA: methylated-DNA--[protein]-cysteine S-methyltransferase, partial [Alphaproteobacteria bacterium]|nr:methylated-DNA--[protein]-cysteine S-methyltransferase [Alphaproteobacteria bacterium]